MKKISKSILLLLIICVNAFAPLSVALTDKNTPTVIKNVANAADTSIAEVCDNAKEICASLVGSQMGSGTIQATGQKISYITINLATDIKNNLAGSFHVLVFIKDPSGKIVNTLDTGLYGLPKITNQLKPTTPAAYNTHYKGSNNEEWLATNSSYLVRNLTANTTYRVELSAFKVNDSLENADVLSKTIDDPIFQKFPINLSSYKTIVAPASGQSIFTTPAEGTMKVDASGVNISTTGETNSVMPACSFNPIPSSIPLIGSETNGTFTGCLAQGFYYIIFQPTAFLFALGGKFFDWTFAYSIQDSSYKAGFVIEGWKIARDLCNIFFIFILLYAAFQMILGIGQHTQGTIVKVIVMGLIINFSLLTTQIIIDSSNILTRLFYNSTAIRVSVGDGTDNTRGGLSTTKSNSSLNELPLSAKLVSMVNPQQIILNAKNINIVNHTDGTDLTTTGNQEDNGIGAGAFFLVTLLSTAINCIGFFIFLSIGLLFVGRVVGLWFAMIFSPLAFFTFATPFKGTKMFGWDSWLKETASLAFMAPIFMFFMYLILLFLSKGFIDLFDTDSHGPEFVLRTIIPFAVIMVLLFKAKGIAKDMAGTIAGYAAEGLAVAGGIAVGVAAGGVSMAGRSAGKLTARASAGNTSSQKYDAAARLKREFGDNSLMNQLSWKDKTLGRLGSNLGAARVFGQQRVGQGLPGEGGTKGPVFNGIGAALTRAQKKVDTSNHSEHELEDIKKKAGIGLDTKQDDWSAKQNANFEREYNEKYKQKMLEKLEKGTATDHDGNPIDWVKSKDKFKADERNNENQAFVDDYNRTHTTGPRMTVANIPDAEKKNIEDRLNTRYKTEVLDVVIKPILKHDMDAIKKAEKDRPTVLQRGLAGVTTNSFNPLDISKISASRYAANITKLGAILASSVALGMRTGLKSMVNVNESTGQRNFAKDIAKAFSEAINNAKFKDINVHVDNHAKADDHGGGHGGDHGGGHGGH